MNDTSPEIAEKMRELIRTKSPFERLRMGCSMYETSRQLVIRAILEHRPHISKTDLRLEIFLKFYGRDFDPIAREQVLEHLKNA